jgi:hypothetical protein
MTRAGLTLTVRVVRHGDDRLVAISEVDVVVTMPAAIEGCRVDLARLQRTAVERLRNAGLSATLSARAPSSPYSVLVDVRATPAGGGCATSVRSELVAAVYGMPEAEMPAVEGRWGSLLVGSMPLVREDDLVFAPGVQHDAAVLSTLDRQLAGIAAKVRSVNP